MNIIGTPADALLADTLPGAGDDKILGQAGDDTLESGSGRDTLRGGAGFDVASFAGRPSSVSVNLATGFEGNRVTRLRSIEGVVGSAFGDSIVGDADANRLDGGDGDDVLDGGAGDDTLTGGLGDDVIEGGGGFDVASYAGAPGAVTVDLSAQIGSGWGTDTLLGVEGVIGTAFDDSLTGDAQANLLDGGFGEDTLSAGGGNDTATGEGSDALSGIEALVGTAFDDSLAGDSGGNRLDGGIAGRDTLAGGAGSDSASFAGRDASVAVGLAAGLEGNSLTELDGIEGVLGTGFGDAIAGDSGANWLGGGAGDDALDGGDGADTLVGGAGDDLLEGGGGFDLASFVLAMGPVAADLAAGTATGEGSDALSGIEGLVGTNFGDLLAGDTGDNWLEGGLGDDTLSGEAGSDTLLGGAGGNTLDGGDGLLDFASYATAGGAVTVDLSTGITTGWATDSLVGIEWAVGLAFADTLGGNGDANGLVGGAGNDLLDGGAGNDLLDGGAEVDTLTGGSGFDVFSFTAGQAQGDTVTDFDGQGAAGADVLLFVGYGTPAEGASFSELGGGFWQVTSADGTIQETILLSNLAGLDSSDVFFA